MPNWAFGQAQFASPKKESLIEVLQILANKHTEHHLYRTVALDAVEDAHIFKVDDLWCTEEIAYQSAWTIHGITEMCTQPCITLSELCIKYDVAASFTGEEPGNGFREQLTCNNLGDLHYESFDIPDVYALYATKEEN